LVGKQTVSWSGEAHALHSHHSGEPFAASRVCDERSGKNRRTALDPAPASQALFVSLDCADAFIDTLSLEGRVILCLCFFRPAAPRCQGSVLLYSGLDPCALYLPLESTLAKVYQNK
jgi:hypothetical protein